MLKKRIIPSLLIDNGRLVKTIQFRKKKYVGDPLNAIKIFNEKFVDELIILNISKNVNNNGIDYEFYRDLFSECFVPVTYGGCISSLEDADKIFKLGIEKISLNTSVLENKNIIKEFVKKFGSQSIVVSIDVKKNFFNQYKIYNNKSEKIEKNLNLIDYIKDLENLGVGEILINSIDHDGTMKGMNLKLIESTCKIVNIPIVYSGGIGTINDIVKAFEFDISAVSAGSFFVFYGPHKAVLISYPYNEFKKL